MASIADKFTDTRNSTNPVITTVTTARSIGGTSLSCVSLSGWPVNSAVHFITYKKLADGTKDLTSQCDWKGLVSGTTIGSLTLEAGSDVGNAIGDFVEMGPTAAFGQDLAAGATAEHNRDGTHDNTKVAMLAGSQTFTGTKTFGNVTATGAVDFSGASSLSLKSGSAASTALNNPYKFSVYASASQSLTASTFTKIHLDAEEFDTSNNFDSVTNFRFTAPVSGFYLITTQVRMTTSGFSSGTFATTAIFKNGVQYLNSGRVPGSADSTSEPTITITKLIQLAAADYLELFCEITDTGRAVAGGQNNTFMSGHLVSTT